MTGPSPWLRAALLLAMPEQWATAREIAAPLDLWSRKAVHAELCIMATEGVIQKRMEILSPTKLLGLYCRRADAHPA